MMESETRPLIQNLPPYAQRRSLCKRIPCELTVTGIIVGLFLLVVTLLIVLENLKASSDEISLTKDLLDAATTKHERQRASTQKAKEPFRHSDIPLLKKSKYTQDDSHETKQDNEQQLQDSLEQILADETGADSEIVNESKYTEEHSEETDKDVNEHEKFKHKEKTSGNPHAQLKLNPMSMKELMDYIRNSVKNWKDKLLQRGKYEESSDFKDENVMEDERKEDYPNEETNLANLLGSPFKYNKKAFDDTWQDKKKPWQKNKFVTSAGDYNYNKWKNNLLAKSQDFSDKLRASEIDAHGPSFKYNQKNFSYVSQDRRKKYMSQDKYVNEHKWDNVDKGWKKLLVPDKTKTTACPLKHLHHSPADNLLMQSYVNCAHIVEEIQNEFGKCIDMSFLPKECKPSWKTKCFSSYKYRKVDGSCNNRIHPTWGKSGTPFVRMIAPDYGDGTSSLRTAKDGSALPNARVLSRKLYSKQMKQDIDVSLLFIYFGLFVDHDMIETAQNSGSIPCCDQFFKSNPKIQPKECLQIEIPPDDPFYGPKDVTCFDLMRSIPVQGECIGRREQLNKATSFLDGSAIYGSTYERAKAVRSFNKGLLKSQTINNSPFMSYSNEAGWTCGTRSEPLKCFMAGDSRVNMMVDLTAMHTLWYREHNRLAEKLHEINPQWTDEILYQEARRIVIAELQHITYNEFLPILLGEKAVEFFGLQIDTDREYEEYEETIDPSVFNVFGTAAFRFGHSLVQDILNLIDSDNSTKGSVPLHETFFNLQLLHHNGLDLLLKGASIQKIHSVDSFMSEEIREHLFQPGNQDYGLDLGAIGIQRGRDHGLPSYVKWRSVCGLPEIMSWEHLNQFMESERVQKLQEVYENLEDIDLIPGALAENHVEDSLLGPTYLCIIGRQFKKTRKGDRFWYEDQINIGSFTKGQLKEIYKSSMARVLCDNSDNIQQIQKSAFKVPSSNNSIIDCATIPQIDLLPWKN